MRAAALQSGDCSVTAYVMNECENNLINEVALIRVCPLIKLQSLN